MSKKPETVLKEKLIRDIERLPGIYFFKTQQRAKLGILDLILCIRGRFVAIELKKSSKDKLTSLQSYNVTRINSIGEGIALACDPSNYDEVLNIIKNLSGRKSVNRNISLVLSL